MEEDINAKLAAITAKRTSWACCLWAEILANLKNIGSSEYKEKLAVILVFSNIEKYPFELELLSINALYLSEFASLLFTLFTILGLTH